MSAVPLVIDPEIVRNAVRLDLIAFERDFGDRASLALNDDRSLFIAWVARFIPEVFDDPLTERIEWVVNRLRADRDKSDPCHNYLVGLRVGMHLLRPGGWINPGELALGNGPMRIAAINAFTFIADRFSVHDDRFVDAIEANFEAWQSPYEELLAMCVLANGSTKLKRRLFVRWRQIPKFSSEVAQILDGLLRQGRMPNPFLWYYAQSLSYCVVRLVSRSLMGRPSLDGSLSDPPDELTAEIPSVAEHYGRRLATTVRERLRADPLLDLSVCLTPDSESQDALPFQRVPALLSEEVALAEVVPRLPAELRDPFARTFLDEPKSLFAVWWTFVPDLVGSGESREDSALRDAVRDLLAVVSRFDPIACRLVQAAVASVLGPADRGSPGARLKAIGVVRDFLRSGSKLEGGTC